ncbi:hypothetical protein [Pseudoprimorskyibacter insulae]|uniref:Uncharacterized protein n=1 Tax=Pseudoprimorskyibacter insulae TaxID=1695997 RepID=A0A2R8ARI0_9RHOB|nr:hypothetical protein [Pseudoprimorskyibacter insulae]SPF78464.1 hypothetical protein PRI8871_01067 [Pseudoprimorskyibacter insulae]
MTQATGIATAPLFGPLLRKGAISRDARILLAILLFLVLWGLSVATFGIVALAMVPLALVPVVYSVLILITVGK